MKTIEEHETDAGRIKNLRSIPTQIAELEGKLRKKDHIKQDYEMKREAIMTGIMTSILSEQDGNGKPKYTNEMQRRTVMKAKSAENKDLNTLMEKQNKNTEEMDDIMINLRFFHNTIKIEGIIARLKE